VVVAKKVEKPKPVEASKPVAVAKTVTPAPVASKHTEVGQATPQKVEDVKKVIE